MTGDPLVSIRCLVYNHEPFLRQCLDGFVMQKTTFPFEAIVHDDASTDGSAAIIREYAEKYPDIIKPIYETENQYSKHDGSLTRMMDAAMHPNSKYIATCEGDDYWTDPNKLQIQVDFLESHPDYVITSHDFSTFDNKKNVIKFYSQDSYRKLSYDESFHDCKYRTFNLDEYFNLRFATTLTAVYRRDEYLNDEERNQIVFIFDFVFFYYIMKKGKCALFRNNMATYRIHDGGVYSGGNTEIVNNRCLKSLYAMYELDAEKRWLPKMSNHFVDLFCYLAKRGEIKKVLKVTIRHVKRVPICSSISCFDMIINRTFNILFRLR